MKPILQKDIAALLPECCRIGFAAVDAYKDSEREQIETRLPGTETVIAIAHHIQDSLEWTWLKFPAARGGETCPADMHCLTMAERIANKLGTLGFRSDIVPYPGICGLMFKTLAIPAGLGALGDNFLFMNAEWGPWMHLRIVLTDAEIQYAPQTTDSGCTHCGKCMAVCPVQAIASNGFNGLACRTCMRETAVRVCDGSYVYECEECLRACPIGQPPREIEVRFKSKTPPTGSERG